MPRTIGKAVVILAPLAASLIVAVADADVPRPYLLCVTNERSGDVTIIRDGKASATTPVGKRPRGVHPSPDGSTLYVALSGSPITGPPMLDAQGNPILKHDEDNADHSADGIGVVDLVDLKFVRKLPSGSDPEEFAASKDGRRLYISKEDVATASVLDIAAEKVAAIVRVKKEPEGVASPRTGDTSTSPARPAARSW